MLQTARLAMLIGSLPVGERLEQLDLSIAGCMSDMKPCLAAK
jgi:hypothetical protein